MTFTNPGQAQSFFGALLLGAATGILYDGLRVIRFRLGGKILGALLDMLFWAAVVCTLFCYAVAAGNGLVRIYMMIAMFGGGVLYFLYLSPLILRLGFLLADLAHTLAHYIFAPFRFVKRITKKSQKSQKMSFIIGINGLK